MESDAIPETALVGLIDRLNRTTRRHWADNGHLRKASRKEGYREEDAAQLAAFVQLVRSDVGDFHEVAAAWEGIKDPFNAAIGHDLDDGDIKLIAVIDGDTKKGSLITREDDFVALLTDDARKRRVYRVVDLTTEVRNVREAFRRILKARNPPNQV